MFVNVADIMEIYVLPYVGYGEGATEVCRQMQSSFCGYVVDTLNDETEQMRLREINKQYQVKLMIKQVIQQCYLRLFYIA